jgi:hypothetical protein
MRLQGVLGVATVALALAAPGAADARSSRLADFVAAPTTHEAGAPAGMRVHVFLHRPGDRSAKPSPLRSAVVRLPAGLRFDTTVVPRCTASDAAIQVLGTKACPQASELTVGRFSADTGFGAPVDPLAGDDHVFNGPRQLVEIITAPGAFLSPAFDRLTISGSTLTAHPPKAPGGPPEGETAVRSLDFTVPVRVRGGRALIRAPRRCPATRRWISTATFGFADGSRDTVGSRSPCKRRR